MIRRLLAVGGLFGVLAALTTAVPARSASAQVPALTVVDQSAFVPSEGEFVATLTWNGPLEPFTLGAVIHGAVDDVDDLDNPGAALQRITAVPLTEVPLDESGALLLRVPIRSVAETASDRVLVPDAGVYPVTIEVRDDEGPVATARTQLIRLPSETAEVPVLTVSTVLVVSSAEGTTVDDAVRLLADHPNRSVTVVLDRGVLTQLEADADLARRFRDAVADRDVAARPELQLDVSALAEIGHAELYRTGVERTRARLVQLGLRPSDLLLVEAALTDEAVAALVELRPVALLDLDDVFPSSGYLNTAAGRLPVLTVDEDPVTGVGGAHRLLAELTIRARTDLTPVVLGPRGQVSLDVEELDVVLGALEQPGVLQPAPLTDVVGARTPLPLADAERPQQDLRPLAEDLDLALAHLDAYEAVYVTGGVEPAAYQGQLLGALTPARNPASREQAVASVADRLDAELGALRIVGGSGITLAAQRSTLPLTIENSAGGTRRVVLRFASDKLVVEQDGLVVELPPGATTIDLDVEARAIGDTPLTVSLQVPDDPDRVLSEQRVRVRSTAVPGLGLLLSGAALAFLVGWWIVSVGRRRAEDADPSEPDGDDPPAAGAPPADLEATGSLSP